MVITVRRLTASVRSTTGRMVLDGVPKFCTLEPPKEPDPRGNGYVCIPSGTFRLTIRWSFKFKKHVPHVEDVPGRTAIEIHIGNDPQDTDGCTLIGMDFGNPEKSDWVGQSAVAFSKLMAYLYDIGTLTNPDSPEQNHVWDCGTITYEDVPEGAGDETNQAAHP